MYRSRPRYWIFALAVVVLVSLAYLFYAMSPGFSVKKNISGQTMQQILEADGVFVSFDNLPRFDSPFKDVFTYAIILDDVSFNSAKYLRSHQSDGVWITGNRPGEERAYIFTNKSPPSSIKELYEFID